MDLFNFDPATMFSFLLTLFRVSILLFVLPFFGGANIPNTIKGAFCLIMAMALWPHLSFPGALMPASPWQVLIMLIGELMIGLILGLTVRVLFGAVQMGGQLIGFQMGYAMINVVDPLTGQSVVITSHFLYMTTLLTFLALDGHLYLLQALAQSFQMVAPGGLLVAPELALHLLQVVGQIFVLAIKIAAPVMAAIFLVDLALALVSRSAPQMNVLMLGFPLKIGVGFLFLGILFTTLSRYVGEFITSMGTTFQALLRVMS
jgi:flagellar biosynthetic protein FliR